MEIAEIRSKHTWYNVEWFRIMARVYDVVEFLIAPLRVRVANKITNPDAKILDVACGTGNQSVAFAKKGFEVVGIDLSPHMLKRTKSKIKEAYKLKFVCGDATEMGFGTSSFDVSSVSFGLHDMPEEIGLAVLEEMKRVTKQNGQIIIVDYATPIRTIPQWIGHLIASTWETKHYGHFRRMGLKYYLNKSGLRIKSFETYLFGNVQIVECTNQDS